MYNPVKAVKYAFNYAFDPQTSVDEGWNYRAPRPVLSEKKRRELMANSALETPRSNLRAVCNVLWTYPKNASWTERAIFTAMLGCSLYFTYSYVQEQVAFSNWISGLTNTLREMGQVALSARPELIDLVIGNYPELQAIMENDPLFRKMIELYPDTSAILRYEDFKAFIEQSPQLEDLLRGTPTMEDLVRLYPGFAEKIASNPDLLKEVSAFKKRAGRTYKRTAGRYRRF